MAAKNGKRLYIIALSCFLLGVGYLLFVGISEDSMPFLNVSEALAMPSEKLQSARLFGTVKKAGLDHFQDKPGVRFQLGDKNDAARALWVVFEGTVPDAFKEGAEVIVEGNFAAHDSSFKAKSLMTKCPSKYQKENRS